MGNNGNAKGQTMKYREMGGAQLVAGAKAHDRDFNEGGDGPNPYRNELRRREAEAAAARPQTKQDELDHIDYRLRTECGSVARDGGDRGKIDALQGELSAQARELRAAITAEKMEALIEAGWDVATTQARREEWNAKVRGGQFRTLPDRAEEERRQGWTMDHLVRAVRAHKL